MKINIIIYTSILLVLTGCSQQIRIKSDYDREVNLNLFKTYSWLPVKDIEAKNNPLLYNELTDKRIKKAVDVELKNKGINHSSVNPDLQLHYHIIVENKSMVSPERYGYKYSQYWFNNRMDVYQYQEGTFIIDLMDAKKNTLIWRGWGTSVIIDGNMDQRDEEINRAVKKILSTFPPKK